jgi:hypothetical protein
MEEARQGQPGEAFAQLRQELAAYTARPAGVGLDVPPWLRRLEAEVQRVHATQSGLARQAENFLRVPEAPLSLTDFQRQLAEWDRE